MPPRAPDEWEAAILAAAGDVRGRDVLELGCGDGGLSLVLLERGARLTALDLSPGMVAVAEERARRFRPAAPARFLRATAEDTGLETESCDLVVGKWVLHHLDLPSAAAELHRVLRPGATAVFMETNARNPVLRWGRRHLTGRLGVARVGTEDEEPLGPVDLALLRERFAAVTVSFPVFQLLQILDRQVLRYRWPRATRACRRLDAWIAARAPWAAPYGHWMLVELRR